MWWVRNVRCGPAAHRQSADATQRLARMPGPARRRRSSGRLREKAGSSFSCHKPIAASCRNSIAKGMQNTSTYIERLVDFVYDCRLERIPTDVRGRTALFVLDTLGVAVTNREKPFVQQLARAVAQTAREGSCTAVGLSNGLVADGAAMVNSTAIHGNDFDAKIRAYGYLRCPLCNAIHDRARACLW